MQVRDTIDQAEGKRIGYTSVTKVSILTIFNFFGPIFIWPLLFVLGSSNVLYSITRPYVHIVL